MDKQSIFILLISYVSFAMFRLSLGLALPSFMLEFEINEAQAGWLYSAPLWSTAVLLSPSGYLGDRFGRVRLLLSGYIVLALGVTLIGFSKDYIGCLIFLVIAGAGAGLLVPSYYTMVGEALKRVRGLALGLAGGVYNVGGLIGSILVGIAIAQQQWRSAYYVIGVFISIMTVAQFIAVKSSFKQMKHEKYGITISILRLVRKRNVFVTSISIFFASMSYFASAAWLPTFLHLAEGLDSTSISIVFGLYMVIGAVSQPAFGALSDRIGRRSLICICGIAASIISLPMFITKYFFWSSIGYSLTLGFLANPYWNLLIALTQESVNKEYVTSVTGILQTFSLAGSAVGPIITGVLITAFDINRAMVYTVAFTSLIYGLLALAAVETKDEFHISQSR